MKWLFAHTKQCLWCVNRISMRAPPRKNNVISIFKRGSWTKKSLFRGSNTAFFETNMYRGSSNSEALGAKNDLFGKWIFAHTKQCLWCVNRISMRAPPRKNNVISIFKRGSWTKKSLFRGSNTAFFETNMYRESSHSVDFWH